MSTAGKIVSVIVTLAIAMSLVLTVSRVAFAADDKKDFSFYKTASVAGSFYDNSSNMLGDNYQFKKTPDKGTALNAALNDPSQMANAGAFVGYVDKDFNIFDIGSFLAQTTVGTQSRSYTVPDNDKAVAAYLQYGHALQALGLDTVTSNQMDFMGIGRMFIGAISLLFYIFGLLPQLLFNITIGIMQAMNPFNWILTEAAGAAETIPALSGVKGFVTDLYNTFAGMGLYVVTLIFAIGIGMSILFWRKSNNVGSHFKKFLIRVIFIAAGLPLLAMTYTAALNNAADVFSSSAPMANKAIASTFVDFAAWAEKSNLTLPEGTTIKVNGNSSGSGSGTVDMGGTTAPQMFALRINQSSNSIVDGADISKDKDASTNIIDSRSDNKSAFGKMMEVLDLLLRYMNTTRYTSGAYESYVKTLNKDFIAGTEITSNKDKYTSVENILDSKNSKIDDKDISYMNNGSPGSYNVSVQGDSFIYKGNGVLHGFAPGTNVRNYEDKYANYVSNGTVTGTGGLSTLSMYNYLNTKFADDTVTNYSSNKLASDYVLDTHHSVSLVGGGFMGIIYWLNMLSILGFIGIVGTIYAFGLVGGSVKRGIKMVTSLPFASLGSIKAISKIVAITASMIIQIYGTLVVYELVVQLFIASQQIFLTPLLEGFNNGNVSAAVIPGIGADYNIAIGALTGVAGIAVMLVMTVFNFVVTIKAVKLRKTLVKSMDEAMAGWIDRFFNTDSARNNLNSRSLGDVVRGGIASGAGMAAAGAANRFVNGTRNPSQTKGLSGDGGDAQTGEKGVDGDKVSSDNVPINGGSIEFNSNSTDIDNVNNADVSRGAALAGTAGSLADAAGSKGANAEQNMSRKEKNELKEKAKLASSSGQTTHMQDEEIEKNKKAQQQKAIAEGLKGAADTAIGAGRIAAGDVAGGGMQAAKGLNGVKNGVKANGEAEVNAAKSTTSQSRANSRDNANRTTHVQHHETTKGRTQEKGPSTSAKKVAGELTVEMAKKTLGGA
jgi:hypothetical membrane protein